jgi:hypothetical protein
MSGQAFVTPVKRQMNSSGSYLLDTIVGELTLLGGRRQSDATHIAVLTPPHRAHADRRRETLFMFLDLSGSRSNGLARAMLERFNRAYWRHPGAVTTVLRQAIGAANAHMLEENRLLSVSQRRRGGIVCAVLRGDNLYLAQIGPARALLAQGERVMPFPEEPRDELPLGVSSGLDIRFTHSYLSAGDMLLLTGESWSEDLSEGAWSAILESEGGVEEAMLALELQAGASATSALIVECVPREVSQVSTPSDRLDSFQSSVPLEGELQLGSVRGTRPRERWRLSNPLAGLFSGSGRLDRIRRGLRQAGMALGDGLRTLLAQVLPEPEPAPRRQHRRAGRMRTENMTMMAGIAVAIPLLVAFVVVTFYLQRSAGARQESLVDKAREAIQAAHQADVEDARPRWDAALQAAQAALRTVPDDDELLTMRDEARAQLDLLDGVLRPDLTQLWDYGPGEGRRLAVTRFHIYMLDAAQQQVTQHTLDQGDQPDLVAYRGESVGDGEIGELRDVVWLEAGGTQVSDVLLILTGDNQLLQYSLSWGLSWAPFDTGLAHVNPRVLRPFGGKLYTLDPEHSQVWRFPSAGDGFGPPEGYFPAAAPDLSSAIDMAIDGAVYILLADGRIYKFLSGEAQPFQLGGLPQPLARPVALVSEGDVTSGALYVADAGAQSIVALTKSGEFIHQIKAEGDALAGLEALAIDESSRTLYILAGGRIYASPLPPLPELPGVSD